jgi:hypothetical protein
MTSPSERYPNCAPAATSTASPGLAKLGLARPVSRISEPSRASRTLTQS